MFAVDAFDRSDMVMAQLKSLSVTLNKPIQIGCLVLDISKAIVCAFYYGFIQRHFPINKRELRMTDTDSLILGIFTNNIYDVIKLHSESFDMSDYSQFHPIFKNYYDVANKKELGIWKDEYANIVIRHLLVLRPKLYCIRYAKDNQVCNVGERVLP